jgi:geranylgeranyl diphosphate synthase type 3
MLLFLFFSIDDIQDDTELRRGVAAAHKLYGIPLTMGSAYYALFLMLSELQSLNQPDMISICIGNFILYKF